MLGALRGRLQNMWLSAECTTVGGGSLRLRIVDNAVPFEPNKEIPVVKCKADLPVAFGRRPE